MLAGSAASGVSAGGVAQRGRTPRELKKWRAKIAAAFEEAHRHAFPAQELHVTYSPLQGGAMQAVLVKADGARDDYTVRLPDGSLKNCTSSRITHISGAVRKAAATGRIGSRAGGVAGSAAGSAAHPQQQLEPKQFPGQRQGSALARVQQLVAMGFDESHADDALHVTGEDISAAIEACLRE